MEGNELNEAVENKSLIEPILEGLTKLSKDVVKRQQETTAKVDEIALKAQRAVEDLEARTSKTIEDVLARQERLRAGSSLLNQALGVITSDDDGLKDLIPKALKENAGVYEHFARSMPKDSPLSKAVNAMAVEEWFRRSTRSMLRKFAATAQDDAQQANKLFEALQEKYFGQHWEAITKAVLAEDAAATGGNLVPTIVEADVIRQIKDAGKLFPRARQIQMSKKVHQVPSETTAVVVNWVPEAGTLTGGEPAFAQKTLTAKKIAGRATMSVELVEDSNVGLLAYLLEVFTEKMAGELDKQLVLGDGSSPAITGIDNTAGIIVVASSATAAGRNLTWPLLTQTFAGLSEGASIENGVWLVSPKGYGVIIGMVDTTGQPIVRFGQAEGAPAGTLIGRPIIVSARFGGAPVNVTSTLDDSTNVNTKIIYGVPSSLLFGTRMGMRWDVTDQVNWSTFQIDARLVGRFAMVVGVAANFARLTKVNY